MININISVTIFLTWIYNLWSDTARAARPGSGYDRPGGETSSDDNIDTGAGTGPVPPQAAPAAAADFGQNNEPMIEDDIETITLGPVTDDLEDDVSPSAYLTSGAVGETVNDGEGSRSAYLTSAAVGVPGGGGTSSGAGERPPPSDCQVWTRVRARAEWTPEGWSCDPHVCSKCEIDRNRRIARHQFHLLNKE